VSTFHEEKFRVGCSRTRVSISCSISRTVRVSFSGNQSLSILCRDSRFLCSEDVIEHHRASLGRPSSMISPWLVVRNKKVDQSSSSCTHTHPCAFTTASQPNSHCGSKMPRIWVSFDQQLNVPHRDATFFLAGIMECRITVSIKHLKRFWVEPFGLWLY
jgi:hypothetical protein